MTLVPSADAATAAARPDIPPPQTTISAVFVSEILCSADCGSLLNSLVAVVFEPVSDSVQPVSPIKAVAIPDAVTVFRKFLLDPIPVVYSVQLRCLRLNPRTGAIIYGLC